MYPTEGDMNASNQYNKRYGVYKLFNVFNVRHFANEKFASFDGQRDEIYTCEMSANLLRWDGNR